MARINVALDEITKELFFPEAESNSRPLDNRSATLSITLSLLANEGD
jgi:hypothetical protein